MKNITKLTAALSLTLFLGTVTAVSADPVSRPLDFATQMTQSFPIASPGVFAGTLHLDVGNNGTVSGWYRDQDAGTPQPVVGGHDGKYIWFDIGTLTVTQGSDGTTQLKQPLQVTGTLEGDRIVGTVQDGFSRLAFTAQPEGSSQQSQ